MKKLLPLYILLLSLGGVWSVEPAAAQTSTFDEDECMFTLFSGETPEALGVTCGYVTVPEQHAVPDGPTIELAIAIIPAEVTAADEAEGSGQAIAPDPLFVAQGGPGGSTLDTFGEGILGSRQLFANLGRDIVLIEQRGTLYSKPNLLCADEETALFEETVELDLSDEAYERLALEAERQCKLRLEGEGVNLAAYNSVENAADMDAVREALGYERFNFYGVSYGTLLGLHLMRDYPEQLRSVVLDAVVPTQTAFLPEVARSADRAYDELFNSCAADSECAAAFPNLEERFYTLVAELNENPATITITNDETDVSYDVPYTGDNLLGTIFGNLYDTSILNALPLIIENVENGNFDFVELDLSFRIFDRTFSGGMYSTVICSEDYDIAPEILTAAGINPLVLTNQQESLTYFLKSCDIWDVPALGPFVNQPVESDIPVLLLSGQYDPITPPAFAETAAQTLPNSYVYTFPSSGHGVITDDDCALGVMRQFLADPQTAPNTACVTEIAPLDFVTPAELVPTSIAWQLNLSLFELEDGTPFYIALWEFLVLLGTAVFLFTVLIIWPIIYLRNLGRQSDLEGEMAPSQPFMVKAAGWIASFNAMLITLVSFGTVFAIVYTYLYYEDIAFFGILPEAAFLFILPFPIAMLTVLMVGSAVRAWASGSWSLLRRIYYTLLTSAAVANLSVLVIMDYFTTLF